MTTINGRACVANGRNLLTGTSSELKTKQLTNEWHTGPQATNGDFKIKVVKGQKYTYRAWLDNTNGPNSAYVNVRFVSNLGQSNANLGNGTRIEKGETGYSSLTFTPLTDIYIQLMPVAYNALSTALAEWKEEKLEKGSVATPWTPAPVDKVFSNGKQVYGRNLLTGTSDKPSTRTGGSLNINVIGKYHTPKVGQEYTLSVEVPEADHDVSMEVYRRNNERGRVGVALSSVRIKPGEKYHVTFTWPDPGDTGATFISVDMAWTNGKDTGAYSYSNVKLEIGNTATAWTPAPEDVLN